VILNQNHKITTVILNHDFKSNDFKSFPTLGRPTDNTKQTGENTPTTQKHKQTDPS